MQFDILRKNLLPAACTRIYDKKNVQGNELHAYKQKIVFNVLFPS
jgi:hypothetical protein